MIRKITEADVKECVAVIRESFQTVADEFGFTKENAPRYTSYATDEERIETQLNVERRPMYGYFTEERMVGYYSLMHKEGSKDCELNNLCVLPESVQLTTARSSSPRTVPGPRPAAGRSRRPSGPV